MFFSLFEIISYMYITNTTCIYICIYITYICICLFVYIYVCIYIHKIQHEFRSKNSKYSNFPTSFVCGFLQGNFLKLLFWQKMHDVKYVLFHLVAISVLISRYIYIYIYIYEIIRQLLITEYYGVIQEDNHAFCRWI